MLITTTKKIRKPGSGRKRKIDALTSKDYAEKLVQLEQKEQRCDLTPKQQEAYRKEKRALKNRLSALKSREKKRMKLDELQKQVFALQRQVKMLKEENQSLRDPLPPFCAAPSTTSHTTTTRCDAPLTTNSANVITCQSSCTSTTARTRSPSSHASSLQASTCRSSCSTNISSSRSSSPFSFSEPKIISQVKPCALNSGSAVSTPRISLPSWAAEQYSHLHWEMPWKTLRLIFSMLWITSRTLIATKTDQSVLPKTAAEDYWRTQVYLKQIFSQTWISCSKTQTSSSQCENDHCNKPKQHQPLDELFNRISRNFLTRAASRHIVRVHEI